MDHSFTCNYTNACLYLVTVHQMAPPQTEVADIFYLPRTLNPCWLKASSSRVIIIEGVGGGVNLSVVVTTPSPVHCTLRVDVNPLECLDHVT